MTLGAPVLGGPKYTQTAAAYAARGVDLDELERKVAARSAVPLRVPVTALYSRLDGVVAWQACVNLSEPLVEHVEVFTTHLGFVLSADVAALVAERLAAGALRPGSPTLTSRRPGSSRRRRGASWRAGGRRRP